MHLILIFYFLLQPLVWLDNINDAQKLAAGSHQLILVYFSGSDWCVPCIRLRKDLLESEIFGQYAATQLLLVRADFPRNRKNRLSPAQVKINEALAERYNPDGKFPYILVLDGTGRVLKDWDGYINETPRQFILELATLKSNHTDGK